MGDVSSGSLASPESYFPALGIDIWKCLFHVGLSASFTLTLICLQVMGDVSSGSLASADLSDIYGRRWYKTDAGHYSLVCRILNYPIVI